MVYFCWGFGGFFCGGGGIIIIIVVVIVAVCVFYDYCCTFLPVDN